MSANSRPCTWLDSGHDGTIGNVLLKRLFGEFLFQCTGREPPFGNGVVARYVDVDAEDRLY
jgi:hypothetical protein